MDILLKIAIIDLLVLGQILFILGTIGLVIHIWREIKSNQVEK